MIVIPMTCFFERIHRLQLIDLDTSYKNRHEFITPIVIRKLYTFDRDILEDLFINSKRYNEISMILSFYICILFNKPSFSYESNECENLVLVLSKMNETYLMENFLCYILSVSRNQHLYDKLSIYKYPESLKHFEKILEMNFLYDENEKLFYKMILKEGIADPFNVNTMDPEFSTLERVNEFFNFQRN